RTGWAGGPKPHSQAVQVYPIRSRDGDLADLGAGHGGAFQARNAPISLGYRRLFRFSHRRTNGEHLTETTEACRGVTPAGLQAAPRGIQLGADRRGDLGRRGGLHPWWVYSVVTGKSDEQQLQLPATGLVLGGGITCLVGCLPRPVGCAAPSGSPRTPT